MLNLLKSLIRIGASLLKTKRELALENLALRQQLAVHEEPFCTIASCQTNRGIAVLDLLTIKFFPLRLSLFETKQFLLG